jgi:glucose/arabinose dehydrogenase
VPSRDRRLRVVVIAVAAALVLAGGVDAAAAGTPVAASGAPVEIVATGVPVPTAFAWDGSTMFAGAGPSQPSFGPGGLFVVANGTATKLPHSPQQVYGLAFHSGVLYVSTGPTIIAMSGWNGTRFAATKTIFAGPQAFHGFSGLAFGPDGRLYAGLLLEEPKYDHTKDPYRLSQAVVSMAPSGRHLRVVARGLRQPFQLTFPKGSRYPYVSDLGQDLTATIPRDQIVVAKPGQNYGFPTCTWMAGQPCSHFNKPLIFLPPHASPMGIGSLGKKLYVALYTGIGNGSEVVTIPTKGGTPTPFVTGFDSPLIALSTHDGYVYFGDQSGTIYKVVP